MVCLSGNWVDSACVLHFYFCIFYWRWTQPIHWLWFSCKIIYSSQHIKECSWRRWSAVEVLCYLRAAEYIWGWAAHQKRYRIFFPQSLATQDTECLGRRIRSIDNGLGKILDWSRSNCVRQLIIDHDLEVRKMDFAHWPYAFWKLW